MQLTLNKLSALHAMRSLRSARLMSGIAKTHQLSAPVLEEGRRWMPSRLTLRWVDEGKSPTPEHPMQVAVPSAESRLQARCAANTVYSGPAPCVPLCDGISSVAPELLFVEMGAYMEPMLHLLLGLELCGTFSRDPSSPRDGSVAYGLEPITSADRIRSFVEHPRLKRLPGLEQSRAIAPYLMDNAWSPREALIAALIVMPIEELGFDLGPIVLNRRLESGGGGVLTNASSRVPDILFPGTHVGLNYDGDPHFGEGGTSDARAHAVRDKLRDRDLMLAGYSVLPVVHEDLSTKGAFDALVYRLLDLLEQETGNAYELQRSHLVRVRLARKRQRLIWSLLPGARGRRISKEGVLRQAEPSIKEARISEGKIEVVG